MDIKDLGKTIDEIWATLKVNLLGSTDVGKALLITSSTDPLSLPGMFDEAVKESGGNNDLEVLDGLLSVASNYLDAEKAKLKAKVFNKIKSLESNISNMSRNGIHAIFRRRSRQTLQRS